MTVDVDGLDGLDSMAVEVDGFGGLVGMVVVVWTARASWACSC